MAKAKGISRGALLAAATILALLALCAVKAEAYSPSFWDSDWVVYTSGDDVVKPGAIVNYRIWGTFHAGYWGAKAKLVARVYAHTAKGWEVIYSDYILPEGSYSGDVSFDKAFSVHVPEDTMLNTPIYLTLETFTRYWAESALSIVQDPPYGKLKNDYGSLLSDYNSLLNEYSGYKATHSHADFEYNKLASECEALGSELHTAKTLNYVLAAVTVAFVVTACLAVRRRRARPSGATMK
jgi:hypothetical protein